MGRKVIQEMSQSIDGLIVFPFRPEPVLLRRFITITGRFIPVVHLTDGRLCDVIVIGIILTDVAQDDLFMIDEVRTNS